MTTITPDKSGTLVINGYGISIKVDAGHLEIEGGVGLNRTFTRLHKVTGNLKRLIVMGHDGFLTIEALHWLQAAGAAVLVFDRDGALLFSSTAEHKEDVRLRRAQAIAAYTPAGLTVTRFLLEAKLHNQAANLKGIDRPNAKSAHDAILGVAEALGRCAHLDQLRQIEARAAAMYWDALWYTPIQFAKSAKVPTHWTILGQRTSALTDHHRPSKAVSPAHASLNYLYAVLAGEARLVCEAIGLDPGLGVNHSDKNWRNSLAADVMEPVRPMVDAWLLEQLRTRTYTAKDFGETREGACRLSPELAREYAETLHFWTKELRPLVNATAQLLLAGEPAMAGSIHAASNKCQGCGQPLRTGQKSYCSTSCRGGRKVATKEVMTIAA